MHCKACDKLMTDREVQTDLDFCEKCLDPPETIQELDVLKNDWLEDDEEEWQEW
jgi:hypothetical protein